ncbi:hypothetical protein [Barrientosiimonas humi]
MDLRGRDAARLVPAQPPPVQRLKAGGGIAMIGLAGKLAAQR